ncbi:YiaA/YiaB family inner membrane protein [Gordonia sp. (in: high G+C Gram-positive bacteria)]|uniref:YiaA/YiaB family inner membrane protein n=1 Tax=Gordonia sp. (in: high G+C Gram-positive bacteria) TaxID=84139 RepID=UPI003C710BEC
MDTRTVPQSNTAAFYVQSMIAFGVSMAAALIGMAYLPMDAWQRGYIGITLLFLVSSTFSLSKVVRDRQEQTHVMARIDEARVEKLMADHDPYVPPKIAGL